LIARATLPKMAGGFAKSGTTRRQDCEKHKIAITTLDYWHRAQKSKPKLMEVTIEAPANWERMDRTRQI
jgi:hypothetical protein